MSRERVNLEILLVNPCLPSLPKEVVSTPFGAAWISASLKERGFSVKMLDMQVQPSFEELEKILDPKPLMVGVAHISNFSIGWSGKVVQFIREALPNTPIIAGGAGATYEPSRTLIENNASAIVVGEGEKTMIALAERAIDKEGKMGEEDYAEIKGLAFLSDGKLVYTQPQEPIEDLNSLPLPDRSIFDMSRYPQGATITSRGCSHACAFCSSADFWGKVTGKSRPRVRLRSSSNVLAEIQELKEAYQINRFYVLDDVFTIDKQRVIDICQGIINQKMNVEWACLARGDQVDPEMLKYMKDAGCTQIHFGLESANDKSLRRMGKGITVKEIGQALTWAREVGLRTRASVILGMPGDTPKEYLETIGFLETFKPNEVQLYALMPYPGSRWGDDPKKYGIRLIQPDSNKRIQSVYEPFGETDLFTKDDMKRLADETIWRLSHLGYVHLTGKEKNLKGGYEFVVSSAFTPIQALEKYANVTSYAEILRMGPLPHNEE